MKSISYQELSQRSSNLWEASTTWGAEWDALFSVLVELALAALRSAETNDHPTTLLVIVTVFWNVVSSYANETTLLGELVLNWDGTCPSLTFLFLLTASARQVDGTKTTAMGALLRSVLDTVLPKAPRTCAPNMRHHPTTKLQHRSFAEPAMLSALPSVYKKSWGLTSTTILKYRSSYDHRGGRDTCCPIDTSFESV